MGILKEVALWNMELMSTTLEVSQALMFSLKPSKSLKSPLLRQRAQTFDLRDTKGLSLSPKLPNLRSIPCAEDLSSLGISSLLLPNSLSKIMNGRISSQLMNPKPASELMT